MGMSVMLNGLPTDDKFNGEKSKCCFCQKKKESIFHIFGECEVIRTGINENGIISLKEDNVSNFDLITKHLALSKNKIIYISNIKNIIWQTRNIMKYDGEIHSIKSFLKKRFNDYVSNVRYTSIS